MQSIEVNPSKYYDELYADYEKNWSPHHLHYGFWEEGIKTHEESLVNTTKTVLNALDIQKGDRILDAGCGVGGSSRYLLDNYDASVVGITYSDLLLKNAIKYSKRYDPSKIEFHFMDYTNTEFKDESFDKIFAIESVCYAKDKHDFIKEAYRILKPGGKLVVVDGFQIKDNLNEEENKILSEFCQGWALPNLATSHYFSKGLQKYGFEINDILDKTEQVKKSSKKMYDHVRKWKELCFIASKLKLIKQSSYDDLIGVLRQKEIIDQGIAGYVLFSATK
ncbi:MAG: methyltransferase domain-containing protein [Methylococcaceae bacterium]